MKKSKLNDIYTDSDLVRVFTKDSSIQLNQSYTFNYKYTQHYFTLLADKYTHLSYHVSKQIQDNLDEIILSQLKDCREDYLFFLDTDFSKSSLTLINYLVENKFDFIICNSFLTKYLLDLEIFDPINSGRVSRNAYHYGKLMDSIDFFGCHFVEMDEDLIICGRRSGCNYNFKLDYAHTFEDDNDCEISVNYYFDTNINKEDFANLYLVRERREKYKHLFRDKSINDLLN